MYSKTETFGAGQESDALYTCLWKYQAGYHLDIYYMPSNSSKTSSLSFGNLFSRSNSSANAQTPKLMTDAIQGIQANFSNLSANTSLIDSSHQVEAI
ncbi:hypothetical protein JCM19233_6211 [Vibrio astriarenae]|nr:hypothetical protein JCM19233_6211 [Vibrio sp. C7]